MRVIAALACVLALGGCISDPRPMPQTHRDTLLETYGYPIRVRNQPDGSQVVVWRRHAGREVQDFKYTIARDGTILKVWDWRDPR